MTGKLIFVSGLTGAGKTTLIGKALGSIENLKVLLTYVTRPMRSGEEGSYEYVFVDNDEYEAIKSRSNDWDETIFHGVKYGSDASVYKRMLSDGINVIVSVTPNLEDIAAMTQIYEVEPVTIWIDTPKDIARARVFNDSTRGFRAEDETVKTQFGILFTPTNDLDEDSTKFIALVQSIIAGAY